MAWRTGERDETRRGRERRWRSLGAALGAGALLLVVLQGLRAEGPGQGDPRERAAIHIQSGPGGGVRALAFSPDGSLLVAAHSDDSARLWDVGSGREVRVFRGHTGAVQSVLFSPDGKTLITGGYDSTVRRWEVLSGRCVDWSEEHTISGINLPGLQDVVLSPNGRIVACAIQDAIHIEDHGAERVWPGHAHPDTAWWDELPWQSHWELKGHTRHIQALAFSPDGRTLASAGADMTARLWDVKHAKELHCLKEPDAWVEAVAFSPDGRLLATGSSNEVARLWEVATGACLSTLGEHDGSVQSVAFSPDGSKLATGSRSGRVKLWEVGTGTVFRVIPEVRMMHEGAERERQRGHRQGVQAVAFSPDGTVLATGDLTGTTKLWDVHSGREIGVLSSSVQGIDSLAFSRDGRFLAACAGPALHLWDATSGRIARVLAGDARMQAVAFSPDGRQVAGGTRGGHLAVWDLASGARVAKIEGRGGHEESLYAEFLPDGRHVLTATASRGECEVAVRRLADDAKVRTFSLRYHPDDRVSPSVALSPDGRLVAAAWRSESRSIWEDDSEVGPAGDDSQADGPAVITPEGKTRMVRRPDKLAIWEIASGSTLFSTSLKYGVSRVRFDGRGNLVATDWSSARIWSAGEWKEPRVIQGVTEPSAVSPDGRLLAGCRRSRAAPAEVCLWDTGAGSYQRGLELERSAGTSSLAFHPDGRMVAGITPDNSVRLWELRANQPVAPILATLIAGADGQWLTILPGGYFACSAGAPDCISVVQGNRAHALGQFDLILNRPDRILQVLGCREKPLIEAAVLARRRRLARMGKSRAEVPLAGSVPNLEIVGNTVPAVVPEPRIVLECRARDERSRLDRILVTVDGVPVFFNGAPALSVQDRGSQEVKVAVPLDLRSGENTIRISAINESGIESPPRTLRLTCSAPIEEPDLWVVALGVSDYPRAADRLAYAAKDAEDIAAFFAETPTTAQAARRFRKVHLQKLTNTQVQRESVLGLRQFLKDARVGDVAIVFAAGHGCIGDDGQYYFGTIDIDLANPAGRGVAFDELHNLLADIPARDKLLLLDTCHAGEQTAADRPAPAGTSGLAQGPPSEPGGNATAPGNGGKRGIGGVEDPNAPQAGLETTVAGQEAYFADLRRDSGASVIAACSGEERSEERARWGNGAFTFAVLEGLRSGLGDLDKDGRIRVSELKEYVAARVAALTHGAQQPVNRRENPANDFVVFEQRPVVIQLEPEFPPFQVVDACLSPTGTRLLTYHMGARFKLWNLGGRDPRGAPPAEVVPGSSLAPTFSVEHFPFVAAPFSANGERMLLQAQDGSVEIWSTTDFQRQGRVENQRTGNYCAAFSPDGSLVATIDRPGAIRLWDAQNLAPKGSLGASADQALRLAFAPSGRNVAAATESGAVLVWEVQSGRLLAELPPPSAGTRLLEFSPDGSQVLTAGPDGALFLTHAGTRKHSRTAGSPGATCMEARFSSDGTRIVARYHYPPGSAVQYDARLWKSPSLEEVVAFARGSGEVTALAFSPDGRRILTGGWDGNVGLWDAQGGTHVRSLTGHRELVGMVGFMPDGESVVTVSCDNSARIWRVGRE